MLLKFNFSCMNSVLNSAYAGMHMPWVHLLAMRVILIAAVYDIIMFLHSQLSEISKELKQNKREIFMWLWKKVKENHKPIFKEIWIFVKEVGSPVVQLLVTHIFNDNIKPAVRNCVKFLVMKYRGFRNKISITFRDLAVYFKTVLPVALKNLWNDFRHSPLITAIRIDMIELFALTSRALIIWVTRSMWNGTRFTLTQAKAKITSAMAILGKKIKNKVTSNAKKLAKRACMALWNWAKDDWQKVTQLIQDYISPRWKEWLSKIFRFMRDELNEHPQVQLRLEQLRNGVEIRVLCATSCIILILLSSK